MIFRITVASLGFVALTACLAFSIWAEWGPYAWVAAAQIAVFDSYSPKLCVIVTILLLLVPMFAVGRYGKPTTLPTALAMLGVPGLAVLGHLFLTAWFVAIGGAPAGGTYAEQVSVAGYLPRNFALADTKLPPIDETAAVAVGTKPRTRAEYYLPLTAGAWPSANVPVVLKRGERLEDESTVSGNIRLAPLPYLVRRGWRENHALFAILIEDGESVRSYWMPPGIFYALVIGGGLFFCLWPSRRTDAPGGP